MSDFLTSDLAVVKDEQGQYAIMNVITREIVLKLKREDITKIMADCCNWLDKEYAGEL